MSSDQAISRSNLTLLSFLCMYPEFTTVDPGFATELYGSTQMSPEHSSCHECSVSSVNMTSVFCDCFSIRLLSIRLTKFLNCLVFRLCFCSRDLFQIWFLVFLRNTDSIFEKLKVFILEHSTLRSI